MYATIKKDIDSLLEGIQINRALIERGDSKEQKLREGISLMEETIKEILKEKTTH